jgi:hypothetical protein
MRLGEIKMELLEDPEPIEEIIEETTEEIVEKNKIEFKIPNNVSKISKLKDILSSYP